MRRILLLVVVLAACSGQVVEVTSTVTTATITSSTTNSPTTTTQAPPTTIGRPVYDPSLAMERMVGDLDVLATIGPRVAGTGSEAAAAGFLMTSLEALTAVEWTSFDLPNGDQSQNLTVRYGSGRTTVLLGAHYDSVTDSPGIDDNGSGTVILLEVARRLAVEPIRDVAVVLVWFGAEEILPGYSRDDHHFGSRAFVGSAGDELPDLMVSVDMVGWAERLDAVYLRGTDPSAAAMVVEVAKTIDQEATLREAGAISDHEPFALAGVPSVMLWRQDNPSYHTPNDRVADPNRLRVTLDLVVAILESLRSPAP